MFMKVVREAALSPMMVKVDRPFWMGSFEITNAQYALFDSKHNSRYIDQQWKDHTTAGYPANLPDQPVIRISWQNAEAFCKWLSEKTGQAFTLPTEQEWEWACRAGSAEPFSYGSWDADYSNLANLADVSMRLHAVTGVNPKPVSTPSPLTDFIPRDGRFDDKQKIATSVGSYQPNVWGLHDMHGNVAEWTASDNSAGLKVARGGSWRDRPYRAMSAFRVAYQPYQRVFNVGFRVVSPLE